MAAERGSRTALDDARLLLELTREVSTSLDLQDVLDKSLAALHRLVRFHGGSIQLIEGDALRLVAAEPPATPEAYGFRLPLGEGFGGRVAVTGEPIYSPDATVDPRAHPEGRARASSAGVRTYFAGPLIEQGGVIGIVQFDSLEVDAFPPETQALVLAFLPTITAAVQNARMFEREVRTIEELREAERLKNDFLAVASHELRTPLASIVGFAHTLVAHARKLDPDAVEEFGRRILGASDGLTRTAENLLLLSQIERGTLVPAHDHVPLGRVIGACIDAAGERTVTVEIGEPAPIADADERLLTEVVRALLSNAEKFSPDGSQIDVRAVRRGDTVDLTVLDRGAGIAPEAQARIFDRFTQLEPADTRHTGGLGIGLYLVRRLCDVMGARVTVESAPGVGSAFTVTLPAG